MTRKQKVNPQKLPKFEDAQQPGEFIWRLIQAWLSHRENTFKQLREIVEVDSSNQIVDRVAGINAKAYGRAKAYKSDARSLIFHLLKTWPQFDEVKENSSQFVNIDAVLGTATETEDICLASANYLTQQLFSEKTPEQFIIAPASFHTSGQFFEKVSEFADGMIIPTPSEMIKELKGWNAMGDMREVMSHFFNFDDRDLTSTDAKEGSKPMYIWLVDLKRPPKSYPDEVFYGPFYSFMLHISALFAWCAIEKNRDEVLQSSTTNMGVNRSSYNLWINEVASNCIFYVNNLPFPFLSISERLMQNFKLPVSDSSKYLRLSNLLSDLEDGWELVPQKIPEDLLDGVTSTSLDDRRTQLVITLDKGNASDQHISSENLSKFKPVDQMNLRYWLSPYTGIKGEGLPDIIETSGKPSEVLDVAYQSIFESARFLLGNNYQEENIDTEANERAKFITKKLSEIGWQPLRLKDLIEVFDGSSLRTESSSIKGE